LKESAEVAIKSAFERYFLPSEKNSTTVVPAPAPSIHKRKRFAKVANAVKQDELSLYLNEPLCDENVDSLAYWKLNNSRFPTLAKMARDYLSLQPTSKDVEGNFSKGRRTIPYNRRSQNASSILNQMLVNSGYNLGIFK
jgi:hAT family C-terminal dimerisation region